MSVVLGAERLLGSDLLRGRRVGVVCNPASVDSSFRHIVDRLAEHPEVTLAAIFGPQHGFRADLQDNMIETPHGMEGRRRVPVYSLYSETREPTAEMLRGVDLLVIDLQDVGARIYTFIYTMANCLRAGSRHHLPVVVCDRPNPIGGEAVEGPSVESGFESFVGQFPIPMRHGLTIGELAQLFNDRFQLGAELYVSPMEGWRRESYYSDLALPWVMPSPNMPTADTALVYPGTVLLEGTNLSEGRGTTRPFELVGAPWIDAERFASRMNELALSGVHFRPVEFQPAFQKHERLTCGGCQIHVVNRSTFRPVITGAALIAELYRADPARFKWRDPPYEYETQKLPIDILAGSSELRRQVEEGAAPDEMGRSWQPAVDQFLELRRDFLLY